MESERASLHAVEHLCLCLCWIELKRTVLCALLFTKHSQYAAMYCVLRRLIVHRRSHTFMSEPSRDAVQSGEAHNETSGGPHFSDIRLYGSDAIRCNVAIIILLLLHKELLGEEEERGISETKERGRIIRIIRRDNYPTIVRPRGCTMPLGRSDRQ